MAGRAFVIIESSKYPTLQMHFPAENFLYNALSQDKQSVSSVPEHVRLKK